MAPKALTIEEYNFLTFPPEILGYSRKLNLWKMKPNENSCQYVISENMCSISKYNELCNEDTYACIYLANESYFTLTKWKIIYLCKSHIIKQCLEIWKKGTIPIRNPPYFGLFYVHVNSLETFIKDSGSIPCNDDWEDKVSLTNELYPKIMYIPGPNGKKLRREITQGIRTRAHYINRLIPKDQFYIQNFLPCNFI